MYRSNRSPGSISAGIVTALAVALLVHPFFGWEWTPLAGAAGGWIAGRRGWVVGAVGVSVAWGAFAAWSFLVDPRAVREMTRVVASILGNLPSAATVVLTLLAGGLLGAAGGLLGEGLRNFIRPVPR